MSWVDIDMNKRIICGNWDIFSSMMSQLCQFIQKARDLKFEIDKSNRRGSIGKVVDAVLSPKKGVHREDFKHIRMSLNHIYKKLVVFANCIKEESDLWKGCGVTTTFIGAEELMELLLQALGLNDESKKCKVKKYMQEKWPGFWNSTMTKPCLNLWVEEVQKEYPGISLFSKDYAVCGKDSKKAILWILHDKIPYKTFRDRLEEYYDGVFITKHEALKYIEKGEMKRVGEVSYKTQAKIFSFRGRSKKKLLFEMNLNSRGCTLKLLRSEDNAIVDKDFSCKLGENETLLFTPYVFVYEKR